MVFMMDKLAMINFCEIILEKLKIFFFAKNHCEIQVRTMLICAFYSIKSGNCSTNLPLRLFFQHLTMTAITNTVTRKAAV
jgi:hypothetical protein